MCFLCLKIENGIEGRNESKSNLENQARKMKMDSDKKFPPTSLADTTREGNDFRNVLAVIMKVSEDGFYQPGTTLGILKPRLQCDITVYMCWENRVRVEDVPNHETTYSPTCYLLV